MERGHRVVTPRESMVLLRTSQAVFMRGDDSCHKTRTSDASIPRNSACSSKSWMHAGFDEWSHKKPKVGKSRIVRPDATSKPRMSSIRPMPCELALRQRKLPPNRCRDGTTKKGPLARTCSSFHLFESPRKLFAEHLFLALAILDRFADFLGSRLDVLEKLASSRSRDRISLEFEFFVFRTQRIDQGPKFIDLFQTHRRLQGT